jgi:hypothetical protein
MTPLAVLANDYSTSGAATAYAPLAQVICIGLVSSRPADDVFGAPEDAIDYETGAAALMAAADVDEHQGSFVSVNSPFGI